MAEAAPKMIEIGLAGADEIDAMLAEMQGVNADESILLLLPKVWQVWGRATVSGA